jgi:putative serine/threonine protein kinase
VSLKQLRDPKYASILCYPRYDRKEFEKRIRELAGLGVKAIEFIGEKKVFNLSVLGKGCVGVVAIAQTKTGRAVLKIRRVDADRKDMEHEAEMLKKANNSGIGPELIGFSENFLLMKYVEGVLLPKWLMNLKGKGAKERIRHALCRILEQCRKLDQEGLDHGELSHAPKHIIIDTADDAHLVDFETASTVRRPSNVTSICQYLFLKSQMARAIRRKVGETDDEALLTALRQYKVNRNLENFTKILEACKLASEKQEQTSIKKLRKY